MKHHLAYIGIGSNLPSNLATSPSATVLAALNALKSENIKIVSCSSLWSSPAWPLPLPGESPQPDFVNAVACIETKYTAAALLDEMHKIESEFGRQRIATSSLLPISDAERQKPPRPLDLDLLDFGGLTISGYPSLPHPRMAQRLFVLLPLAEIAPKWRDPVSGRLIAELIAGAPPMKINKLS